MPSVGTPTSVGTKGVHLGSHQPAASAQSALSSLSHCLEEGAAGRSL